MGSNTKRCISQVWNCHPDRENEKKTRSTMYRSSSKLLKCDSNTLRGPHSSGPNVPCARVLYSSFRPSKLNVKD